MFGCQIYKCNPIGCLVNTIINDCKPLVVYAHEFVNICACLPDDFVGLKLDTLFLLCDIFYERV